MSERLEVLLRCAAPLAIMVLAIACLAPRHEAIFAAICALITLSCQLEYWLWARYQNWPTIQATIRGPLRTGDIHNEIGAQIEYTIGGETYLRPAYDQGGPGEPALLLVNPADPRMSGLPRDEPAAQLGVAAISAAFLVSVVLRALIESA